MIYKLFSQEQVTKVGLNLSVILLLTLSFGNLFPSHEILRFTIEEVVGQAQTDDFLLAELLNNSPTPPETEDELLQTLNQSSLISHLQAFQGEFVNPIETCTYPCDLSSANITTVNTVPGNLTIHYKFSEAHVDPQNQPYALLMLNFADNASTTLNGSSIDYNVKINGSDFHFEDNATTDTGFDIKTIHGVPSMDILVSAENYSIVIDILSVNNNPVSERTRPLSVNFTYF